VGSADCVRVLAGLVRIVMAARGGDWATDEEVEPEITRRSSGLLEFFVPIVSRRVISRARSVAVGWEAD
jgi:hypothetical protein